MSNAQHVRKRSSKAVFEAIERLERLFEVRVASDQLPLKPGDFLTFEEWDPATEKYTGRRMTFRVSYNITTKELAKEGNWRHEDLVQNGLEVYGLVPPEYRRLRSVLSQSFLIAMVIEKRDMDAWSVINGPVFLPYLVCPPIDHEALVEFSNVRVWPPGLYSVHWMIHIEDPDSIKEAKVDIVDMLVWTWTAELEGDDSQTYEVFMQEILPEPLRAGDVMNIDGAKLVPAEPQIIYDYSRNTTTGDPYAGVEYPDDFFADREDYDDDDDMDDDERAEYEDEDEGFFEDDADGDAVDGDAAGGAFQTDDFIEKVVTGQLTDEDLEAVMFDKPSRGRRKDS